MKIWLDGQCLQTASRYRGIGRYVSELLSALLNIENCEVQLSFNAALPAPDDLSRLCSDGRAARVSLHAWESIVPGGEHLAGMNARRAVSELALSHHVGCLAPDVAISASPFEGADGPAVPLRVLPGFPVPVAGLFYDAIPFRFAPNYLADAPSRAFYDRRMGFHHDFALNLCISDFCRREALELFPDVPAINASCGVSSLTCADARPVEMPKVPERFVLYVGGLDWRKNVPVSLAAFALLPDALRHGLSFVVAGKNPEAEEQALHALWVRSGLPAHQLVFSGRVTDAELASLYRRCALLVQPSRMEGFGLTAAEAMLVGAPVAGGRAGALPEVIGRDDLLFDPDRPDELAVIMQKLLTDPAFRDMAIAHGQCHVQRFTWLHTADVTFEACRNLAASFAGGFANLTAARAWTAGHARRIDLPSDWIAGVLARAEPGATPIVRQDVR